MTTTNQTLFRLYFKYLDEDKPKWELNSCWVYPKEAYEWLNYTFNFANNPMQAKICYKNEVIHRKETQERTEL